MKISATQEQVAIARRRLLAAAGPTLRDIVPRFGEAIDALPSLDALPMLAVELRIPVLDALKDAGADVPFDVWSAMGVAWAYRP